MGNVFRRFRGINDRTLNYALNNHAAILRLLVRFTRWTLLLMLVEAAAIMWLAVR